MRGLLTHLQVESGLIYCYQIQNLEKVMSKKSRENKSTRTPDESKVEESGTGKGHTNNPGGRPRKELCFTDTIRRELNKKKRFRRSDGTLMEASELELIALKVVRELRQGLVIDNKLLAIVLDRIEGKPKETVELDATVQAAGDIDPRDILLQRLSNILKVSDQEDDED